MSTRNDVYIRMTDEMGRGVFTKENIGFDTVIELAEILVLSKEDTKTVNETELQFYTFKFNDKQDCLVLGIGEIFNHSNDPNVKYELMQCNGRKKMVFTTLRGIYAGEQLFIDYTQDERVDTSKYTVNLI